MNETARADDGPLAADGAASAAGAALAAVAAGGVAVPIRRGVAEPAVATATVLALVALGAFLARRYGVVERRRAGAVAVAASVGVVLSSGYALNVGATGDVGLPGLSGTLPFVFVTFLAGGGAAGLGVAQYAGVSNAGLWRRTTLAVELTIVGAAGLIATQIGTVLVALPVFAAVGEPTQGGLVALSQVGRAVGTLALVVGYLRLKGYDLGFVDLRVPSLRDLAWGIGGVIALFAAVVAITELMAAVGAESSQHGTAQQAEQNPELMLVYVPAAILVIGPFEELLYRNVIQKSLYGVFSRAGAVVVASVIFAAVHLTAYDTAAFGAVLASLATVFGLSLTLGIVYERTENLLVPAAVHGLYNAIVFANLYGAYA
ncbi:CPBP family intramembrane glutamic endopeptidase [Salinilacihabitans rarus]|uniref:CPBP family intramembrane glutamic endopeptidase n=1 Tax=Salinilacihabitans rarus TaxID=2961596 RepID=UPI0020C9015E|nr:CPBP family intramembrane glutamic endopeptidase [Salinilacihabitans rarus]